jgi:glycosyltransferase involved in cell wall biosynthesis
MSEKRIKILVVGMADSVHLARWLSQFVNQPIDIILFPSSPHRRIHPMLKGLMHSASNQMTVKLNPPAMRWLALPFSLLDIPFRNSFRSRLLRNVIDKNSFDLIHVLEIQHAGYLLLGTKLTTTLPKVFVTNWGSDIYWFEQFPNHKAKIIQLLQIASHYSAECQRDIEIVGRLGYTGATMPVIPNSGGINLKEIPKHLPPPSQRKKIMIKGYTGFVGRALLSIKACELVAEHLRNYEVVIYSASFKARIRALKLRRIHKVQVTIVKKRTPHHRMIQLFSEARIYIGISLSDGISTSLLEAMAVGCYPIQTDTSCASEWLPNKSFQTISDMSVNSISTALNRALTHDSEVDTIALSNMATIEARADSVKIEKIAHDFYLTIVNC